MLNTSLCIGLGKAALCQLRPESDKGPQQTNAEVMISAFQNYSLPLEPGWRKLLDF
jgi:hypothetical protein